MSDSGGSALMNTYRRPPVTFTRGSGSELFDAAGNRFLDFLSGLAVTSLGHSHPLVAEAIAAQSHRLQHVSNLYGNELAPEVAQQIDSLIGAGAPGGGRVFFANSGAEANECAIKLARRYAGPGRHVVMSTWGSFHGRTLATLHATGQREKHAPYMPLPEGFEHVAYGDVDEMARALDPARVAAVLVEAIQGEAGVIEPPEGYLVALRELCTARGILLMVDEVQTGLGRTGRWFAFEHAPVRPDVVTLAKALGNGMPVGACWAASEVAASFGPGDHATTFGGQPLALAAARATLEVMVAEDVPRRAERAGRMLTAGLAGLPGVLEVRGKGLLLGVGLELEVAAAVEERSLELGLVVNAPRNDTIRLAPSLLVSDQEIEEALAILGRALGEIDERRGPGKSTRSDGGGSTTQAGSAQSGMEASP